MSAPVITYPPELPVSAARDEIAAAIRDHQVVIVAGATGSGKTTQLPKICLELGRERIAHTQPRRLAARTIAERVAEELHVPLGGLVGYKVRFTDQVSNETRIALMTDGILLNEIHRDRLLRRYDTIIIDEAHERSLNVDFLLGYLHRILPERPDLKVIITSATIDPHSFAKHFAADGEPAPVIEVSGRTYPVEIRYRPLVDPSPSQLAEANPADSRAMGPNRLSSAGRATAAAGTTQEKRSPTAPNARNRPNLLRSGGAGRDAEPEDEVSAIVAALRELDREDRGDVLVFLPGEAEIRDAADAVRGAYRSQTAPVEVLPLYGRLSAAEQHRVFEPSTVAGLRRRVILATNVAETSLTVPGIKYVIDTGTARISRYSNRSKVQQLPIEAVSQASANQRSGRAGRTSAGIAIRLYGEDDFDKRPEYTEPEILRTSLASVVLQMLSLGFGDIAEFPFLTPPASRDVKSAVDLLVELGAVQPGRAAADAPRLTRIGREIARMPIDPRFARMLVESAHPSTASGTDVTAPLLAIVAGLSIQDVRERPSADAPQGVRDEADRMHARFADPTSDFLSILNLWNYLREQQRELGSSAFRRLCRAEHLNYVRVREWFDVHRQLRTLVPKTGTLSEHRETKRGDHRANRVSSRSDSVAVPEPGEGRSTPPRDDAADPDAIHRAVLSGLLSQIGILDERNATKGPPAKGSGKDPKRRAAEYRGARGIRFSLFPGSALRKKAPGAVMAAEIVETSRMYARTAAAIDPAWAEALAGDLAKRQVSEPHWSKEAGAAVAFEKVTLFGVEIVPRRRVQFARIDRAAARELFLRHALVEGEWDPARIDRRVSAFWRSNAELRRRLEKLEERERRRDILVGDEAVFRFYDQRIPADVFDVRSFEAWWREALAATPKLLVMRDGDLLDDAERADQQDFPTRWTQADQVLGLAYRFEPGAADDGVSAVIPLALLQQVRDTGFDWQVPGLRAELVTALLRALPKSIRRHVVPAADWADKFGVELAEEGPESHDGLPSRSLLDALARLIQPLANQRMSAADFDLERVPAHLRMNFRAVDERGRVVGSGRDLATLQRDLADRSRESVSRSLSKVADPVGASKIARSLRSPRPAPGIAGALPGASGRRAPAQRPGGAPAPGGTPGPGSAQRPGSAPTVPTERDGLTTWDFGDLPAMLDTRVAGGVVRGYPALIDQGKSVSLRVEATAEAALAVTREGVLRLVLLGIPSPASYVQQHLTSAEKLALAASPYPNVATLIEDARTAVARAAIDRLTGSPARPSSSSSSGPGITGIVRSEAEFGRVRDGVSAIVVDELFALVGLVAKILTKARDVERAMKGQNSLALLGPLKDIRGQLSGLLPSGFIADAGVERLTNYLRYLEGILDRLRALADAPGKDRARMTEYERMAQAYADAGGTIPLQRTADPRLVEVRWLLEEYRVSLFAQRLGTAQPVSPQRIVKVLSGG